MDKASSDKRKQQPNIPPASLGRWMLKLSLRAISCIFAPIIIGTTIAVAVAYDRDASPLASACPPASLSLIWNIIEILTLTLLLHPSKHGTHPAAVVALDLLIWLGYGASIGTLAWYGLADDYYDAWWEHESNQHGSGPFVRAAFAFCVFEFIIHIALFVIGCVETNVRNKYNQVVYVQPGDSGFPLNNMGSRAEHV